MTIYGMIGGKKYDVGYCFHKPKDAEDSERKCSIVAMREEGKGWQIFFDFEDRNFGSEAYPMRLNKFEDFARAKIEEIHRGKYILIWEGIPTSLETKHKDGLVKKFGDVKE